MESSFEDSGISIRTVLQRPKVPSSILRNAFSKTTSVKDGSRMPPTQSTILPIRESTSLSNVSFELQPLNPLDYRSSNFPSLLQNLGVTSARSRSRTGGSRRPSEHRGRESLRSDKSEEGETYNFAEELRKRNETRWLRIQAVAKDTMERYERYSDEINRKNRRQRSEIRRRNREQLEKLRQEEDKKREVHLYNSSHGRMWRHHRSIQRRALQLEELGSQHKVGYYPVPATVR